MLSKMHIEFPIGSGKAKLMAQAIDQITKANPGHKVHHVSHHDVIREQVQRHIAPSENVNFTTTKMLQSANLHIEPEDTIILDEMPQFHRDALMAFLADKPVFVVNASVHAR